MAVTWTKIEPNIYQCIENPKKFRVDLYYGRDERGRIIKSKKVVEGNLTEARVYHFIKPSDQLYDIFGI